MSGTKIAGDFLSLLAEQKLLPSDAAPSGGAPAIEPTVAVKDTGCATFAGFADDVSATRISGEYSEIPLFVETAITP